MSLARVFSPHITTTTIELDNDMLVAFPDKNIEVSAIGGEFPTLTQAIAVAGTGTVLTLHPGTYVEAPISIPVGVCIVGVSSKCVTIVASDINLPLFTLNGNSIISGIRIQGVTNHACIYDNSTTTTNVVRDVIFETSREGLFVTGGASVQCHKLVMASTITRGIYCTGTGGIIANGVISDAVTSVQADSGEITITNISTFAGTNAFYANGGTIDIHGANIKNNTNVIRLDNGGTINGVCCNTNTGNTNHILQEDVLSTVNVYGSQFDSDKIIAAKMSLLKLHYNDLKMGDESITIMKELHVGVPEQGYETVMGEGDSYTRGMLVYTETAGGSFVNVSVAAASTTGSTFTFPGVANGNKIYFASSLANTTDKLKFLGLKCNVTTAVVLGGGEIICEYWNGAWVEFNHMSSASNGAHYPFAKAIFERVESEQIRFNLAIINDWAKNDPIVPALAITYFWIRISIATTVTSVPVLEQAKLHTNRTEINDEGWLEYFGLARPTMTIPWDYNSFLPIGTSPADADVYALNSAGGTTQDLGVGRAENKFQLTVDSVGLCTYAPYDIDTSCPIILRWSFIGENTGNVVWFINFGITRDGSTIGTTVGGAPASVVGELHLSKLVAIGSTNTQISTSIEIDVSDIVSRRAVGIGDLMWISIARDGNTGSDTINGNVDIIQISPVYTRWAEGYHV